MTLLMGIFIHSSFVKLSYIRTQITKLLMPQLSPFSAIPSPYLNCMHLRTTDKVSVAYPEILFGREGGSTKSAEDRENGDLGAVAP